METQPEKQIFSSGSHSRGKRAPSEPSTPSIGDRSCSAPSREVWAWSSAAFATHLPVQTYGQAYGTFRTIPIPDLESVILPGLVSVTFRGLFPREVVDIAVRADLRGLMWGGDVHVPAGRLEHARGVGDMTRDAGLKVESFGSYYRAGTSDSHGLFEQNLDTALALGAERIRIWAGNRDSELVGQAEREAVIEDLRRCDELASSAGVRLALEFHGGTLTDTAEAAATLMEEVRDTAIRLYWQPPNGASKEKALAGLKLVLPWVDNVHVFHWILRSGELVRLPLTDGGGVWPDYLDVFSQSPLPRWAMLEFVQNDDPEQFLRDARQLALWLEGREKRLHRDQSQVIHL